MDSSTKQEITTLYSSLPARRVEPNDKLTKEIFNLDDAVIQAKAFNIVEIRNKDSPEEYKTLVTIAAEVLERFDSHDREVALACISLQHSGNGFTTDEQIYRVMTGNPKARLRSGEEAKIKQSLVRLMSTTVEIDLSALRQMGYTKRKQSLVSQVLPIQFVTGVNVNGSSRTVVKFLAESPLMTVAKMKNNQLITYDLASVNVGGRISSDLVALRNYTLRRIEECRVHSKLAHSLTFNTLFDKNGLSNKNKTEKKRYRDFLVRCFQQWKANGTISDFNLVKKDAGYHAISFQL